MSQDEMDEPHPYQGRVNLSRPYTENDYYPLGNLDFKPGILRNIRESSSVQLVNEYGWIWLWRDGQPSKLTTDVYEYYLGKNSTPAENWELQAYWLQLETEWLRSEPSVAGVLAFCYLTNNYGYTGDWFRGSIRDLQPTPALDWFRHAFAPAATFINLTDERYTRFIKPHDPGSQLLFNLAGVNNLNRPVSGTVRIWLIDDRGKVTAEQQRPVRLESFLRTDIPVSLTLPSLPGGYVLVAGFTPSDGKPVISRRFLRIGQADKYSWFSIDPLNP
jgi:hypothetical protein